MTTFLTRALAAGFLLGLALTPASARVLAKIDGAEITDDDVRIAMDDLGPTLPAELKGPEREAYVLDYLLDVRLVAKNAEKDKLDQSAAFQQRMAYYRDKVLMETVLGGLAKSSATPEAIRQTYDDVAKQQKPQVEIHARHILVPTEPEAQAVVARLKAGEDFAKVADEVSKDPGSQGGDLGWFTRDKMVPEFAEAAFKMKKDEVSGPVKSQFGWHVIQVLDIRDQAFPPFDQVKDQVARYVVQKAQSDLILKLRNEAKIEKMDAPAPVVPAVPVVPSPPKP